MFKNLVPAPRAALLQYRVPPCAHTRAALVRIRTLRRHAMLHATTTGGIMHTQDDCARAYASGALRRHAMLHIIPCPTHVISSAYRNKLLMPLPFDCNKFTLASQS